MTTQQLATTPYSVSTEEELAGPVSHPAPTRFFERVSGIDVLRGVALLGILVLNIDDFGNPELLHDIPVGTPINNFVGPHAHLNLALLMIKWAFFEGKMRGLFSMLFGAGVILLTSRAERRGRTDGADIYTRRNLWLLVFGVLHACLIWHGDILFDYGFQALLFLYPMRKLSAKTLLWSGTFLSLVVATLGAFLFLGAVQDHSLSRRVEAIHARQQAGLPLSQADNEQLEEWRARVESQQITPQKTAKAVAEATLDYPASVLARANEGFQGTFYVFHINLFADILSAMLIGMGLMKLGFFTGELSNRWYVVTAAAGFGISIPIYVIGIWNAYLGDFNFLTMEKWVWLPYYLTREAGSLAIASVVVLLVKCRVFTFPQYLLAAVGRTAFSNYILTSLLCQTLFVWGPWKLYGRLEYFQLMYVVFAVWAVNLIVSPLWLRWFAFGPLEWMWRSLTYAKVQPMRVRNAADSLPLQFSARS